MNVPIRRYIDVNTRFLIERGRSSEISLLQGVNRKAFVTVDNQNLRFFLMLFGKRSCKQARRLDEAMLAVNPENLTG